MVFCNLAKIINLKKLFVIIFEFYKSIFVQIVGNYFFKLLSLISKEPKINQQIAIKRQKNTNFQMSIHNSKRVKVVCQIYNHSSIVYIIKTTLKRFFTNINVW